MRGRANRRHHLKRIKHRIKQKCKVWGHPTDVKAVGKLARTPANCSCPGCCNQRRNDWQTREGKLTMQERRRERDIVVGLEEQCPEK